MKELIKEDKKFLGRDANCIPLEVTQAEGSYLFDSSGKKYIDFLSGWCVGNIGWNIVEINEKIRKYNGPNYVLPEYLFKPWVELAEILANITPGKLIKSFRVTGGTEAVELAIQIAMKHTKRSEFISIEGSYHGHSIGAMSIGSSDFRKHFSNLMPNCHKINPPLNTKSAKEVIKILQNKKTAAFVCEPIICNLGVEIPDKDFFQIVRAACKKYGTLFVADEVATGFGRTGKLFASEHYNLEPDIMCLAKGLTGGYGALGATITTTEIAKSMEFDFSFYSTYGWHPINTIAAIANLKYLIKNKLWENAEKMGKYFEKELQKIKFKYPAKIRIKGLAIGIEFSKSSYAEKIVNNARKKGCIFSCLNDKIITIFPALNINKKIIDKGLDIIKNSVSLI